MVAEETSGRKSLLERVLQFLARPAIGADTLHDRSRPGSQAQEETIQEVPRCVWPHTKDGAQVYGIVRNTTGEGAEWQLYAIDVKTGAEKMLAPLACPRPPTASRDSVCILTATA
jgi:hypothetical protein